MIAKSVSASPSGSCWQTRSSSSRTCFLVETEAHTAPLPGGVAAGGVQQIQEGVGGAPGQANGGDSQGEVEAEEKLGSGTSFGLHFELYSYTSDDGPTLRRPGSGGAGNDNEALYLAKPGRAVGLVSEDDRSGVTSGSDGDGSGSDGDTPGGSDETPDDGIDPGGDDDDGGDGDPGSDDEDEQDADDDGEPEGPIDTRTNRLPSVPGSIVLAAVLANEVSTIADAALLRGVFDADGDQLSVTNLTASSGSLLKRADGFWEFTPDTDDTSDVVFTYAISDGNGSITQTAFMDILPLDSEPDGTRIIGTSGNDLLIGTERADWIDALEGDDDIIGREGNDTILGGPGNDRIVAGDGDDLVFAGDGDDVVFAGLGNDVVFAGMGDDIVYGEDGNDTLLGEDGDDVAIGGAGDDLIDGGKGNDRIQGDDGNDTLLGGLGNDEIDGGAETISWQRATATTWWMRGPATIKSMAETATTSR